MTVRKSVERSQEAPTSEEIAGLLGEQMAPPRVYAYEIAQELGCDPSALSKFINGRGTLPHGQGIASYRAALKACKRRKAQGAAA